MTGTSGHPQIEAIQERAREFSLAFQGVTIDETRSRQRKFLQRPQAYKLHLEMTEGDLLIVARAASAWWNVEDYLHYLELIKPRGISTWVLDLDDLLSKRLDQDKRTMEFIASWHRETRSEAALARIKEARRHHNLRAGYGFKFVGPLGRRRIVAYPEEQAHIEEILRLHTLGYTWGDIERLFKEKGYRARVRKGRFKLWSASRIRAACEASGRCNIHTDQPPRPDPSAQGPDHSNS